jgi:hypothetical protein
MKEDRTNTVEAAMGTGFFEDNGPPGEGWPSPTTVEAAMYPAPFNKTGAQMLRSIT